MPTPKIPVRVSVSPEDHERLRRLIFERQSTYQAVVEAAIREYLDRADEAKAKPRE